MAGQAAGTPTAGAPGGSVGLGNSGSLPSPQTRAPMAGGQPMGNPPLMTAMPQAPVGQGMGGLPGQQGPQASGMPLQAQAMQGSGMGPTMRQQAMQMAQQRAQGMPGASGMNPGMGQMNQAQNMQQLQQSLQQQQAQQQMMRQAMQRQSMMRGGQ